MKIGVYDPLGYEGYAGRPAAMEAAGYDTLVTDETRCDPYVRSTIALTNTSRAEIMTGIAVAFARTPMGTAYAAHDMQVLSKGRFQLGLGSQVKPHIMRRFGMPWSNPAPRMKEYVKALHAIWDSWYDGKKLEFKGSFYSHTLMTPMFTPTEPRYGRPKVHLGAVGPYMTKAAAEVADGLITHSLTTPGYIRDVTLPMIEDGLAARGLTRKDFEISGVPFVATAETEKELKEAVFSVRKQIAFYCSTPSYRGVLDHQGWGELHEILHPMSREGLWDKMAEVIDDTTLNAFAVVGSAREVVPKLRERYIGIYDRISVRFGALDPKTLSEVVGALKA